MEEKLRDAQFVEGVHRVAAAIARVRWGSLAARELVADVIGDTYTGTLKWDPDHVPLRKHVSAHVRQRVRSARRLARMHTSLPEVSDEMAQVARTATAASVDPEPTVDPGDLPMLLDELRHRAAEDPEVLALLSLYERGITRKARILALGMSDGQYRNARRRLLRFAMAAADALKAQGRGTSATAESNISLVSTWTGIREGERQGAARAGSGAPRVAEQQR
ncbi:MAG: hypothetical protein ABIY55_14410 [Kofleriaceae bacterium]